MEELYNYIEAYFTQTLGEEERRAFEERCVNDKAFADDVAFYIASRNVIREKLLQQKQQQWATAGNAAPKVYSIKPQVKSIRQKLLPYMAAACLILVVSLYFIFKTPGTQQLAAGYIKTNYSRLEVTLDAKPDSLQQGVIAYNNKDYKQALKLFELLEIKHPGDGDEKKYAGLVYLVTQEYDKALQQFDALAKMPGLAFNAGNFLKAVTLMERDAPGDKQQAKLLLQQVVRENTEGAEEAKKWLDKF